MHIPNDNWHSNNGNGHNGHNGNGHNGHNPHFYWIDHELVPTLDIATMRTSGINHIYSPELSAAGAKHAEYMMNLDRVINTAPEKMFGEAENVCLVEVTANEYKAALWRAAENFARNYDNWYNLNRFKYIGNAVAVKYNKIFVVQRFAVRKEAC